MARAKLLLLAILAIFTTSAVGQDLAARGGNTVIIPTEIEVEVDESSSLRTGLVLRLGNEGGCSVLRGLRGCVGDLLTLRLKAIVREGNVLVAVFAVPGGGRKLQIRIPIDLASLAADLTLTLDLSNINIQIGKNVVRLVGPDNATIGLGLGGSSAAALNLRGGAQPGVGLGVNLSAEAQAAIGATLQGLIDLSVELGVNAAIALDILLVVLHLLIDIFLGLGLDINLNIANLVRVALNA